MKISLPPPGPGTWDEDEDALAHVSPWDEVMWWADRGIEEPLLDMLKSEAALSGDDRHIRDFIVGRLTGKIKRPVGKPRQRPRGTFVNDFDGTLRFVREAGEKWYAAAKCVQRNKKSKGLDVAVEIAAKQFNLEIAPLHKWLRSSKKERVARFGMNYPK